MKTQQFGEVVFFTQDKYPKGIVLRESSAGVVLEEHFDDESKNVDVLHIFQGMFLHAGLKECLTEARTYEGNLETPIHVELWSENGTEQLKREVNALMQSIQWWLLKKRRFKAFSFFQILTFIPKYVIIQNRLPRGQKKRFYFNVLKNGKKQIIKREKK